MSGKKILFIVPHRKGRSPGQRFRFEQYIPYLEKQGFECTYSYLLDKSDDKYFYKKGYYLRKMIIFFKMFLRRWRDVKRAGNYDIIFIYREAFFTRTTLFEKLFSRTGAKIVFDFDDAIWIPAVSKANRLFSWLKDPEKINRILPLTDLVFAGNEYLATHAKRFAPEVRVIPTTIDTSYHSPEKRSTNKSGLVIGWTGSYSTLPYFESILPVLKKIRSKYSNISFLIICDEEKYYPDIDTHITQWSASSEIEELGKADIGIMPLPDDKWAEGKCGFKALQYMAMEIVPVVSPVGVNKKIVEEDINGFHARTDEEWESALTRLIEDDKLRERLGQAGREKIKKEYSVNVWKDKYLKIFNNQFKNSER